MVWGRSENKNQYGQGRSRSKSKKKYPKKNECAYCQKRVTGENFSKLVKSKEKQESIANVAHVGEKDTYNFLTCSSAIEYKI